MELREGGDPLETRVEYIRVDVVEAALARRERALENIVNRAIRDYEDSRYRERQVTALFFMGLLLITLLAMVDAGRVHIGRKTPVEATQ